MRHCRSLTSLDAAPGSGHSLKTVIDRQKRPGLGLAAHFPRAVFNGRFFAKTRHAAFAPIILTPRQSALTLSLRPNP